VQDEKLYQKTEGTTIGWWGGWWEEFGNYLLNKKPRLDKTNGSANAHTIISFLG